MRYLTFALTKGRLADKTLAMLEKIGITCEEMKDKDSRKLIFVNEELKLKFFLAKGPDVPTYVEYGAADIGIVGKDTILAERGQTSSNTFRPFSLSVLPVSTISTITSDSPTIGASSMEPFNLMISSSV